MSGPLAGRHVAVLGGGLAGLAAALECADLGARVTLVERRRRLGGLTWSFEHDGFSVDNGQHVFLSCCDSYLAFLARIGASADVVAARPLDVPVVAPGTPASGPLVGRLRRRDLPVPLHLAGALMRYPHIDHRDRLRLGPALLALRKVDPEDAATDRITFGEWLAAHGQSARVIESVWDLITVPTVNLPAAESSLAVAAMVFRTGVLGRRDAADIGWSAVPLGHLHGGRATAALAAAGVRTVTGTRVTALREHDGAGWELVSDEGVIAADMVVCALPHEEAVSVLPGGTSGTQGSWESLGSSAIVDVHLFFDRTVMAGPLMAAVSSPVQWVFDRSLSAGVHDDPTPARPGDSRPQYLAVSLSAADELLGERPERLVSTIHEALTQLLPAAAAARLTSSLVTKERRATFRASPGSTAARPPARTSRPGLALAGAWTATGWPATMEGAVRSGLTAARELARHPRGEPGAPPESFDPRLPLEVP